MSNLEILALPDVVAALQAWWDETPGFFMRGTTSAVVADLLTDHGYVFEKCSYVDPQRLDEWMRQPPHAGAVLDEQGGAFHEAAGIFRVSAATAANPRIMHMVNWFGQQLRALGVAPSDMARNAVTLISAEDCRRLGWTVEFREYHRYAIPAGADLMRAAFQRDPVAVHGFAPLFYGMHFKLNDVQPVGQIDCWCGEHCVTARVY